MNRAENCLFVIGKEELVLPGLMSTRLAKAILNDELSDDLAGRLERLLGHSRELKRQYLTTPCYPTPL